MSEKEIDFNRYFVISEQQIRDLPMHLADQMTQAIRQVEEYYAEENVVLDRRLVIEENCAMFPFVESDLRSYINEEPLAYNRLRNNQEVLNTNLGRYLFSFLSRANKDPARFYQESAVVQWHMLEDALAKATGNVREAYPGTEIGGSNTEANTAHMIAQQARENNERTRELQHDKKVLDNAWAELHKQRAELHKQRAELGKDVLEWSELMQEYVVGAPEYQGLMSVLREAYWQASVGKGAERHAGDQKLPFHEQPIYTISRMLNSPEGLRYQIIKKIGESKDLIGNAKIRELYGAIVYTAALVLFERERLGLLPDEADIKRHKRLIQDISPDWLMDMKPNGSVPMKQRGDTSDDESTL